MDAVSQERVGAVEQSRVQRVPKPEVVSSFGAKVEENQTQETQLACDHVDELFSVLQAAREQKHQLEKLMAVCRPNGWLLVSGWVISIDAHSH